MRKQILTIALICLTSNYLQSQDNEQSIKWFIRPSFGYTFALNPKNFGFITDNLTTYTNQNFYWQILSGGRFFNNWGIEFNYLRNQNNQINNRSDRFTEEVNSKYSSDYYLDINTGFIFYDQSNLSSGLMERGSIGPIYKIEHGHFLYIFRGMIGVMSFSTDWGSVFLKEKGTNSLIKIGWSADRPVKDLFSINPSCTFSYKITKRIKFDADVNFWLYNLDFNYTETFTDYIKNESISTLYHYKKLALDLSFGAGMIILIK
jgi:hypothetical protein